MGQGAGRTSSTATEVEVEDDASLSQVAMAEGARILNESFAEEESDETAEVEEEVQTEDDDALQSAGRAEREEPTSYLWSLLCALTGRKQVSPATLVNNVPVEASLFQLAIEEGVRIVTKPDAKETDEEEEAMQIDDEDSVSSTVGAEQEQPEFSGLVNGDVPMKEEEDSDCSQDQESVVTNDFFTAPSESSSLLDCSFFSLAKHDSDQEQDSRELENAFLSLSFDGKSADEEDETTRMIGERIPPLDSDDEHEKRPVSVQYCEASHQGDYCPYGFWCGVIRNQKPAGVNAPNEEEHVADELIVEEEAASSVVDEAAKLPDNWMCQYVEAWNEKIEQLVKKTSDRCHQKYSLSLPKDDLDSKIIMMLSRGQEEPVNNYDSVQLLEGEMNSMVSSDQEEPTRAIDLPHIEEDVAALAGNKTTRDLGGEQEEENMLASGCQTDAAVNNEGVTQLGSVIDDSMMEYGLSETFSTEDADSMVPALVDGEHTDGDSSIGILSYNESCDEKSFADSTKEEEPAVIINRPIDNGHSETSTAVADFTSSIVDEQTHLDMAIEDDVAPFFDDASSAMELIEAGDRKGLKAIGIANRTDKCSETESTLESVADELSEQDLNRIGNDLAQCSESSLDVKTEETKPMTKAPGKCSPSPAQFADQLCELLRECCPHGIRLADISNLHNQRFETGLIDPKAIYAQSWLQLLTGPLKSHFNVDRATETVTLKEQPRRVTEQKKTKVDPDNGISDIGTRIVEAVLSTTKERDTTDFSNENKRSDSSPSSVDRELKMTIDFQEFHGDDLGQSAKNRMNLPYLVSVGAGMENGNWPGLQSSRVFARSMNAEHGIPYQPNGQRRTIADQSDSVSVVNRSVSRSGVLSRWRRQPAIDGISPVSVPLWSNGAQTPKFSESNRF